MQRLDFSLSTFIAGLIAIIVGFASSAALVIQAATAAGATPMEVGSWLLATGIITSITTIGLSLYYRVPILTSWSTPGVALLVTSLLGIPMSEAIGTFIFVGVLTLITGLTGIFEKITNAIPKSITSAMLTGIMLHFGIAIFTTMQTELQLVLIMFLSYIAAKQIAPKLAILIVLISGIAASAYQGLMHFEHFHFALSTPVFTTPVFKLSTLISVGIPLFLVTMTSQNIPGISVIKSAGFNPPASTLISWTGLGLLISAPFGACSLCLAAVTSAICASEEAHPDPKKRYMASVWTGVFYLITGLFGATTVALFTCLPKELLLVLAGFALLSSIASNLRDAMLENDHKEAALITLLITTSGITFLGFGSAFWGLIIGGFSWFILTNQPKLILASRTSELIK